MTRSVSSTNRTRYTFFEALGHTMDKFDLPVELFKDLLSAFRQDVTVKRYANWAELLDYCRRSANPIGRIVLRLAGYSDPLLDRQSDCVCSALQITNFLQDFGRDWKNGRLYVPLDMQNECGAKLADLEASLVTPEWRATLERCVEKNPGSFSLQDDQFVTGLPVLSEWNSV